MIIVLFIHLRHLGRCYSPTYYFILLNNFLYMPVNNVGVTLLLHCHYYCRNIPKRLLVKARFAKFPSIGNLYGGTGIVTVNYGPISNLELALSATDMHGITSIHELCVLLTFSRLLGSS